MQVILAGDVGATKAHLALYQKHDGHGLTPVRDKVYASHEFDALEEVAADFLKGAHIDIACFGVAGPVIEGVSHGVNIAWSMDEKAISRALGGAPVALINDLAATAYGLLHLGKGDLVVLQSGAPASALANIAVIAAGTGLGEAALIATAHGYRAVASEGGHCDFAPRGRDQEELLSFLAHEHGHVSYERVLSGPGLHNIYRFLVARGAGPEPEWLTERMRVEDPSAVISEAALSHRDPRCKRALEMFVEIYGAEASNLALKFLALRGVYIGGGMAPKIRPFLERGGFMRPFLDKGRLSAMLQKVPVQVSLNESTALIGAAQTAAGRL